MGKATEAHGAVKRITFGLRVEVAIMRLMRRNEKEGKIELDKGLSNGRTLGQCEAA